MFFADPVAAFTNIGRALRPGGAPGAAGLAGARPQRVGHRDPPGPHRRHRDPRPSAGGPDPFSLADPAVTEGILAAAGFAEVGFTDVHEPVYYGPDSATAFDVVLRLLGVKELLADLDAAAAEQARTRLRATLAAHDTGGGVYFDSRAWIVTATLPGRAS